MKEYQMLTPIELGKMRFRFLYKLYEKSEGSEEKAFSIFAISKELGFDYILTEKIFQYLRTEGLVVPSSTQTVRTIRITHHGIMEVEQALTKRDTPTEHFPQNIYYISNVGGDVIGVGVTGPDSVIGKNINISQQKLQRIPPEYSDCLVNFIERLKNYNIPEDRSKPIQDSLTDFIEEIETIKDRDAVTTVKQKVINSKFSTFVEKILKVLPTTAETVAAFTPLSPFSKLIGESVQQLVKAIQKDIQ